MARNVKFDEGFRNHKYAFLCDDGSLVISVRSWDHNGKELDKESFVVSSQGVKNLRDLLDRAAEQRDEAAGEGAGETPNSLRTED